MTRKEIIEYQQKMRAFYATPLGSAFRKFENAHSMAWQFDGKEDFPSESRTKKVWEAEKTAREALLNMLMPLAGLDKGHNT